jgi:hypothetical protein
MRKRRLRLGLGLVFALIAVLIAGMSVPLIWPNIANYKPKKPASIGIQQTTGQALQMYSEGQ